MLYYPQKLSLSKPESSIRPTGREGLFISGTFETVGENGLIDREIKAYSTKTQILLVYAIMHFLDGNVINLFL
jgi:hypothetical protein